MRNKKLIVLFCVLLGVTLLILLGSVIFSVRHVEVHCYNVKQPLTLQQVTDSLGIKKNKNIFSLSKDKVIANVYSSVPNVKIINVEKKFPNRIIIDYIEIIEYIKVHYNNQTIYASNEGKVLRIKDGLDLSADSILVKLGSNIVSAKVGEPLQSESQIDLAIIVSALDAFSRINYRETVIDIIKEIDITNHAQIILKTSLGMQWKLLGGEYMYNKLHHAMSFYLSDKISNEQKKTGVLTVWGGENVGSQFAP